MAEQPLRDKASLEPLVNYRAPPPTKEGAGKEHEGYLNMGALPYQLLVSELYNRPLPLKQ